MKSDENWWILRARRQCLSRTRFSYRDLTKCDRASLKGETPARGWQKIITYASRIFRKFRAIGQSCFGSPNLIYADNLGHNSRRVLWTRRLLIGCVRTQQAFECEVFVSKAHRIPSLNLSSGFFFTLPAMENALRKMEFIRAENIVSLIIFRNAEEKTCLVKHIAQRTVFTVVFWSAPFHRRPHAIYTYWTYFCLTELYKSRHELQDP